MTAILPWIISRVRTAVQDTLRGIGQIFLQPHAGAGLCFLLAVFVQSRMAALACLLGALTATAYAAVFYPAPARRAGLYGYNSGLIGIGVLVALSPSALSCLLATTLGIIATIWSHHWRKTHTLSPYTAPFIATIWLVLAIAPWAGWPPAQASAPATLLADHWGIAAGVLRGVAQVLFMDHPASGLLCVLGLAWANPWTAARTLFVSALMMASAWGLGFPLDPILMGLYGFNAVLVSEALHQAQPGRWLLWTVGILLSLLLMRGFQQLTIPALTAPFVLSTWVIEKVASRRRHGDI
ncbi:MAG: urea transporter [Castellaniella sp.]|uniref:urea transporter n=1 Tax=Castellaniella sp. TaxID=1955812 RepID=UPI003A8E3292